MSAPITNICRFKTATALMTVDAPGTTWLAKGVLYALGLGILWMVLALVSPTTTYHLAPLLVVGTPPVFQAIEEGQSTVRRLALVTAFGLTIALVFTGALALTGGLEGPSLLPTGGAALESAVFALAGAVGGLVVGSFIGLR